MSKKRLITSAVIFLLTALLIVSRIWTPIAIDLAFGFLAVLACIEVAKVAYGAGKINNMYVAATFPAVLYLCAMLYLNGKFNFNYLIFIYLMIILAYFLLVFILTLCMHKSTIDEMAKTDYKGTKLSFALDKSMFTLAILIYPATLFLSVIFINHYTDISLFADKLTYDILPVFLLVLTFAITMVCDSLAMVGGMLFKGKKLCPNISPNKHISGSICGLVGGVAVAVVVYELFMISPNFAFDFGAIGGSIWHIIVVGLIGSVISQIGDILASLLKRHADVKDYGDIFPGHGGVMDRVDGLIFNSLFILIYFIILAII